MSTPSALGRRGQSKGISSTQALYLSARRKRQASITVLDRNGNDKVITAMVWKTTTGETFEMKTID